VLVPEAERIVGDSELIDPRFELFHLGLTHRAYPNRAPELNSAAAGAPLVILVRGASRTIRCDGVRDRTLHRDG
jgi:hypothetical protein